MLFRSNGTLAPTFVTVDANYVNAVAVSGDTMSGVLDMGNNKITSLATPTASTDAATKAYVDGIATGLQVKASVVCATTTNLASLSGLLTIDGITVTAGQRVLVKNQTASQDNGIYVADASVWSRATDMDTWAECIGAYTFVSSGTTNASTGWIANVTSGGTLGTTPLPFTQFSASTTYTAGSGLTLTGNAFSITAPISPALGGTGVTTLTGIPYGNGISAFSAATGSQIAGAIGFSPVALASSIAGGTANQIPYQSAAGSTSFISTGTAGQVLTSNGSGSAPTFSNASTTYVDVAALYGTTSSAIQSAINAYPNRTLYLKAGNWTINSAITIANPVTIIGDGTDSTLLLVSINSDVFTITANGGCIFRDFAIGNLVSQISGGSLFTFNGVSGNQRTVFDHVSFYNIYFGIKFTTANVWTIRDCYFTIYNTAISIANSANDAGDSNITGCVFNANSISQGTAIYQESAGGLRVVNNKFLNGLYHYIGQYNTPTQNTSIFVFVGNSSEGAKTANLAFNTTSYPFQGLQITGNQFSIGGSFGGSTFTTNYGIQFVGNQISDVMIGSNEFNGSASGQVIYFGGGGTNITVGTNTFNGTGGTGTGAAIGVGSGNPDIYFMPQHFDGYSSNYAGSSNAVRFAMGQAQNGQISPNQTTTSFGGGFYTSGWQTITFPVAFPQTPNVNAVVYAGGSGSSNTGGVIGLNIRNITSTSFDVGTIGVNSSGSCLVNWQAWLTGQ